MRTTIALAAALVVAGCASRIDYSSLSKPIQSVQNSTETIRVEAKKAVELAPAVKPHIETIKAETVKIDKSLDVAQAQVAKLQEQIAAEQQKSQRWLRTALAITIFASGLAVAVSIALFLFGHLKSLLGTVIAIAVFGAAVAMQILLAYLIYIAIGFGLLIAGVILWYVLKHRTAQAQLVQTVEQLKPNLDLDRFATLANSIQSKFTKAVVDRAQSASSSLPLT